MGLSCPLGITRYVPHENGVVYAVLACRSILDVSLPNLPYAWRQLTNVIVCSVFVVALRSRRESQQQFDAAVDIFPGQVYFYFIFPGLFAGGVHCK